MSLFLPPATGFFLFFFLCVFLNLSFATERYHHTLARMAIIKTLQVTNAGEGVEKREPSYTVGGSVNWYNHYREQ